MRYYHIVSKSEQFTHPVETWYQEFRARHECPRCPAIDPDLRRTGVDVWIKEPPDHCAVNRLFHPSIKIARRDFLKLFGEEALVHLKLGRVYVEDGRELEEFATFLGDRPIPIRGGRRSRLARCEACGRFKYSCRDEEYLLKSSLTGQPIYESESSGLIINQELRDRIDRPRWKGIYLSPIAVLDKPKDGIEQFPENYYYREGGPIIETLMILGQTHRLEQSELHIPKIGDSRWLFLVAGSEAGEGVAVALWEVELPLLQDSDDLHGHCIHVQADGQDLDGDTLRTDITGASELTYLQAGGESYAYVMLQILFHRVCGRRYRCRVYARLAEGDDDPVDLIGQDNLLEARADFEATIDEEDPYADFR